MTWRQALVMFVTITNGALGIACRGQEKEKLSSAEPTVEDVRAARNKAEADRSQMAADRATIEADRAKKEADRVTIEAERLAAQRNNNRQQAEALPTFAGDWIGQLFARSKSKQATFEG